MAKQRFSVTVEQMKEILAQRDKALAEMKALYALLERAQPIEQQS